MGERVTEEDSERLKRLRLRSSAYHEAGHAVANYLAGYPPCAISLDTDADPPTAVCGGVQGGLVLSAYEEVFVAVSGAVGESFVPAVVQAGLQTSTRDVIHAAILLFHYLGPSAVGDSIVEGSLGTEFHPGKCALPVYEVIDRIADEVVSAFEGDNVKRGLVALAEQLIKGQQSMGGAAVYELLGNHLPSRRGSLRAPQWFWDWCSAQGRHVDHGLAAQHWDEIEQSL